MAEKVEKVDIKTLDIVSLVNYELAAKAVCQKYENTVRNYNGLINADSAEYKVFESYNSIHRKILMELEKRLNNLK